MIGPSRRVLFSASSTVITTDPDADTLQHYRELRHYVERDCRIKEAGHVTPFHQRRKEGGRINIAKAETEPSLPPSLPPSTSVLLQ